MAESFSKRLARCSVELLGYGQDIDWYALILPYERGWLTFLYSFSVSDATRTDGS